MMPGHSIDFVWEQRHLQVVQILFLMILKQHQQVILGATMIENSMLFATHIIHLELPILKEIRDTITLYRVRSSK